MMPIINQDMTQPLLARDVVRFAASRSRSSSPSRSTRAKTRRNWSDVDYDPLPAVVDMSDAAAPTTPSGCSRRRAPT